MTAPTTLQLIEMNRFVAEWQFDPVTAREVADLFEHEGLNARSAFDAGLSVTLFGKPVHIVRRPNPGDVAK